MVEIKRDFIKYVSLNVMSMIALSCYILGDAYFVAKGLGGEGLAALNFSISVYSIINGFGLMIGIGGGTDYSLTQHKEGEGNRSFSHAVFIGGCAALVFVLMGIFFTEPLSNVLGAEGATLPLTVTYLRTILLAAPFFIFNNISLAYIRNDNNPKLPMIAMITSSFSNIVLDYVFMFVFGWGMFGAAFATSLSPVISLLILSKHFRTQAGFKWIKTKISLNRIFAMASYGFSSFIVEIASAVSLITFNLIIMNIRGTIGVGAYGIVANIALIETAVFVGISQGIQPLASRSFSLGKKTDLKFIFRASWITAAIVIILCYGIVFFFAEEIGMLFNSQGDPELLGLAVEGLRIYFIGYFFAGFNIVTIAYLSAVLKTKEGMFLSILRSIAILIPMVFILQEYFKMRGAWLSFVFTEGIVFLIMMGIFYSAKRNRKERKTADEI